MIDLHGYNIDELQQRFPEAVQHLVEHVKPERDLNPMDSRRIHWWLFGRPGVQLRESISSLPFYIATTETSKHRIFQSIDASIAPDQKIRVISVDSFSILAVLSSRQHVLLSLVRGGLLGPTPSYHHTDVFDPFPFPDFDELGSTNVSKLLHLGERIDAFRKARLEEYDFLTMTSIYNVLERLRELDNKCDVPPLTDKERDIHEAGLVSVLAGIHDDIDRAVFEAYGWEDLIPKLVGKPGATTPSPHKTPEQEEAEEELLSRLVALNHERAAEEKQGKVRWLRPDYQIPKLGHKVAKPAAEQIEADVSVIEVEQKPKWPKDGLEQIRVVRDVLVLAKSPVAAESVIASIGGNNTKQKKDRIVRVLETLVATGAARSGEEQVEGKTLYFLPR